MLGGNLKSCFEQKEKGSGLSVVKLLATSSLELFLNEPLNSSKYDISHPVSIYYLCADSSLTPGRNK